MAFRACDFLFDLLCFVFAVFQPLVQILQHIQLHAGMRNVIFFFWEQFCHIFRNFDFNASCSNECSYCNHLVEIWGTWDSCFKCRIRNWNKESIFFPLEMLCFPRNITISLREVEGRWLKLVFPKRRHFFDHIFIEDDFF